MHTQNPCPVYNSFTYVGSWWYVTQLYCYHDSGSYRQGQCHTRQKFVSDHNLLRVTWMRIILHAIVVHDPGLVLRLIFIPFGHVSVFSVRSWFRSIFNEQSTLRNWISISQTFRSGVAISIFASLCRFYLTANTLCQGLLLLWMFYSEGGATFI